MSESTAKDLDIDVIGQRFRRDAMYRAGKDFATSPVTGSRWSSAALQGIPS